jgi:hypothetical protein
MDIGTSILNANLSQCTYFDTFLMNIPTFEVRFFLTDGGTEPVRDWLRKLPAVKSQATPKSDLQ